MTAPSVPSARNAVRHRLRDGMPALDATPVPFNMVRLEELTDQIGNAATPTLKVFQCRFAGVPTQQYMNAKVCPGTLVAYVDNSWVATIPTQDVDVNGNFTLPIAPTLRLLITYAWQYLSDGEIDQAVEEARQWLREFSDVTQIPDGLVPALVSYASHRAYTALAGSASQLTKVGAGDSQVDWAELHKAYQDDSEKQYAKACAERQSFYTQGPEALDPTVGDFSSVNLPPYGPLR